MKTLQQVLKENDNFERNLKARRDKMKARRNDKKPIEDTELSWEFLAGVATFALTLGLFFWHYS